MLLPGTFIKTKMIRTKHFKNNNNHRKAQVELKSYFFIEQMKLRSYRIASKGTIAAQ